MYGQFTLIERDGETEQGGRIYISDLKDKNEAWLRDTLLKNPELIPIGDIDPTFGDLIPLCKEMRTSVGPVDAVFINRHGRLTIVECKLWSNPEARRKVVAQALDYVSAISSWTYGDLQRQVSIATGRQGNIPYEYVQQRYGQEINEKEFVDSVSRSLSEGRFLVLIAGDGIREGVQSLTELVSRNATKAFSFALLEVAVFEFSGSKLLIQPRILAQTEVIERQFITTISSGGEPSVLEEDLAEPEAGPDGAPPRRKRSRLHLKDWWEPILTMKFDDPEQEAPYWVATNNAVLNMPYPGIVLKAWSTVDKSESGIFLSQTRKGALDAVSRFLHRERADLAAELPQGTKIVEEESYICLQNDDLSSDDERFLWMKKNLNLFVNVLRPRFKQWRQEALD